MEGSFNRGFALVHAARAVLRVVPAAVVILDRRLRFRVTNGAARRLFDPEGETGRTAQFRNARPREFGAAVEQLAAAARIRKQRIDMTWPSPDAALYRVTADPAPHHVVIVAREVSPAEMLGASAVHEQFMNPQKAEPPGRFATDGARDFKNLFTVIQTNAAVAQASLPHDSPVREELAAIISAAHRASRLTQQLIAFGRRQVLRPQAVDVNEIVKRVSEMLRQMLGTRIAIDLRLEPALWPVFADSSQLEQLLTNVAENARDAMPAGGTITVKTASVAVGGSSPDRPGLRPGSYVMIRITDTGPGIEPNVLPHIFEPFFTTKQPRVATGLGLSTVYGIVKQSGGYVYADSPPGAGAHLVVLLPRYNETSQSETADAESV